MKSPPFFVLISPVGIGLDAHNITGGYTRTLEEIKKSEKHFLTPADINGVLGTNAHTIRCTARQRPDLLGFPFVFSGNRMKIPRIPFLRFMGEDI